MSEAEGTLKTTVLQGQSLKNAPLTASVAVGSCFFLCALCDLCGSVFCVRCA